MKFQFQRVETVCVVLLIAFGLAGCASEGVTLAMSESQQVGSDIFPGNYWNYSMGTFQKAENFANVERAQSSYSVRNESRSWSDIPITNIAHPRFNGLRSYQSFDVRWKLKDGREFILENIDVRSFANDYLRKTPIQLQLQWQRENRPRDSVGDSGPLLAHEIKDDTVLLKWVIRINRTPVNQRLTPTGAATKWDISHEEILMATLKGNPTNGIDFNSTYELRK